MLQLSRALAGCFNPPESALERASLKVGAYIYTLRDVRDGVLLGRESVFPTGDPRRVHCIQLAGAVC